MKQQQRRRVVGSRECDVHPQAGGVHILVRDALKWRRGELVHPRIPYGAPMPHRARVVLVGTLLAVTVLVPVGVASAGGAPVHAKRHAQPLPDGIGIAPGKIKHVWLIILENKSYDATFTGLNRNTYLWRKLPAQGALLKNYYGTGHGSLDNYTTLVSGQATEPDLQFDCPTYYNVFAGHMDRSRSLARNPNYGQWTSAAGPNAAFGQQRVCLSGERADGVQPVRRGSRRAGRATPRTSATRTPARPIRRPTPASGLRRAVQVAGTGRQHDAADPGDRERDRSVPAQALPVRLVLVDPAVRRLQRAPHRERVLAVERPVPRPSAGEPDARVQLDHPEHVQRRTRRRLPGQQPLGRVLIADPDPPAAATTRAVCTRPTCSCRTSSLRSRPPRRSRTAA